jgi:hypothetical protein
MEKLDTTLYVEQMPSEKTKTLDGITTALDGQTPTKLVKPVCPSSLF